MALDVRWNDQVCVHAGECVKSLPQVFRIENGQFVIDPGAASDDEVRAAVAKCPSGALSVASSS